MAISQAAERACERMSQPPNVPPLSLRKNFSWTLIGNVTYAGCQWAMLVVLAKLGRPELIGQFALGLAITAPIIVFTNLQLRAIQATDAAGEYRFGDYLGLRLLMTAAAILVIIGIGLVGKYRSDTAAVIVIIGLAKAIEALSDLLYGLLQQHERFDRIARSMMVKGALSLVVLAIVIYVTGSMIWGALGLAISWLVVLLGYDLPCAVGILGAGAFRLRYSIDRSRLRAGVIPDWEATRLTKLAILALPMGITTMLLSLNVNIPRYVIQHFLGERELGIFAALAYATTAGPTIVSALGQSASPRLSKHFARRELAAFRSLVGKLLMVGMILGVGGIAIALIAGRDVLRLIYTSEYARHAGLFNLLMIAVAIGYLAGFIGYAVTSARYFRPQAPLSVFVVGTTALASAWLVPRYGLTGAAWALLIAALAQLAGNAAILVAALRYLHTAVDDQDAPPVGVQQRLSTQRRHAASEAPLS